MIVIEINERPKQGAHNEDLFKRMIAIIATGQDLRKHMTSFRNEKISKTKIVRFCSQISPKILLQQHLP